MYNHSAVLSDTFYCILHFYNKNYVITCKETIWLQGKSEIIKEMMILVVFWFFETSIITCGITQ